MVKAARAGLALVAVPSRRYSSAARVDNARWAACSEDAWSACVDCSSARIRRARSNLIDKEIFG